jgi:O-antigen biosynthesis protein WbqV
MGEPVRIVDLARNILRLNGLPFKVGQTIVFTGLRPGEKLHEELFAYDETTSSTSIPKVKVVTPSKMTLSDIEGCLASWEEAFADPREPDVIASLTSIFPSLHGRPAALRASETFAVR